MAKRKSSSTAKTATDAALFAETVITAYKSSSPKKDAGRAVKKEVPKSDVPVGLKDCEICGAPAGSFHHPDCIAVIPAFLRRKGPKLTAEQIKRLVNNNERTWIMPDRRKYAKEFHMAIDKVTPIDPLKPIQANIRTEKGTEARLFDNLEEFEKWHVPEKYILSGQIKDASLTIVTAETVEVRAKAGPETAEVRKKAAQVIRERAAQEKRDAKEKRKAERAANKPAGEARPKKEGGGGGVSGSVAVTVGGKSYGTIKTALKALGIPDSERKPLRALLLKDGKATLKGHAFTLRDAVEKKDAPAKEKPLTLGSLGPLPDGGKKKPENKKASPPAPKKAVAKKTVAPKKAPPVKAKKKGSKK